MISACLAVGGQQLFPWFQRMAVVPSFRPSGRKQFSRPMCKQSLARRRETETQKVSVILPRHPDGKVSPAHEFLVLI